MGYDTLDCFVSSIPAVAAIEMKSLRTNVTWQHNKKG
jgi:hypothetical protein